jgi:hypothetical protein
LLGPVAKRRGIFGIRVLRYRRTAKGENI